MPATATAGRGHPRADGGTRARGCWPAPRPTRCACPRLRAHSLRATRRPSGVGRRLSDVASRTSQVGRRTTDVCAGRRAPAGQSQRRRSGVAAASQHETSGGGLHARPQGCATGGACGPRSGWAPRAAQRPGPRQAALRTVRFALPAQAHVLGLATRAVSAACLPPMRPLHPARALIRTGSHSMQTPLSMWAPLSMRTPFGPCPRIGVPPAVPSYWSAAGCARVSTLGQQARPWDEREASRAQHRAKQAARVRAPPTSAVA